jgi:hypothetical protein
MDLESRDALTHRRHEDCPETAMSALIVDRVQQAPDARVTSEFECLHCGVFTPVTTVPPRCRRCGHGAGILHQRAPRPRATLVLVRSPGTAK